MNTTDQSPAKGQASFGFHIPRRRTLIGIRNGCIHRLNRVSPILDAMQIRNPHLGLAYTGDGYTDTLRYRVLAMYESRLEKRKARREL